MGRLKKYIFEGTLVLSLLMLFCLFLIFGSGIYFSPYHVTVDCEGNKITADTIKDIQKQQEDGYLGLINIAGWGYSDSQRVAAVDTRKDSSAKVIGVYGDMSLVFQKRLLAGSFGRQTSDNYCVITKDLSWELFGSTDTIGKIVEMSGKLWTIDGVLEKKGSYILIPDKQAEMDYLELVFKSRKDVDKKVEALYPGLNLGRKV